MKWALVTGASSGIGWHITMELAVRGYNIIGASNQPDHLQYWKNEVTGKFNVEVSTKEIDLSLSEAPRELYDWCKEQELSIEVLINNAGILIANKVVDTDDHMVSILAKLHVHTPTMLCRLFGRDMAKRGHGYILNVSSISAVMPFPIISLYGPSKTYLRSFSRALRTELGPENVKVSCILPGATDTPLNDISDSQKRLAFRLGIMMTPQSVAKSAISGLFADKAEIIPGLINKLIILIMPFLPQLLVKWAFAYYQKRISSQQDERE